ncbi:zonadhesin-like [Arctopsyche grandis]|uniref:zonadhesin-like n=1 Tax=Arctopsyche grandis TaxID=121162 RepID=UPI00406D65BB
MSAYGFHDRLFQSFRSYLMDRQHFLVFGTAHSRINIAGSGVPQGSYLRPLIFNLFKNDIGNLLVNCRFSLYGDDLKLYLILDSERSCELLQDDLNALYDWSLTKRLPLNVSKCKLHHHVPVPMRYTPLVEVLVVKKPVLWYLVVVRYNNLGTLAAELLARRDAPPQLAYVRKDTRGILLLGTPPSCPGSHEVYTVCGGPGCEGICPLVFSGRTIQQLNYNSGKATCPTGCSTPACVCAEGYTRDSDTGQCVLTPDCPPPSCPGSHEVYTVCGGPGCEGICPLVFSGRTIQQLKYNSGKATCPTGCSTPACVCAEGYTRNSDTGQCVLTPDCPPPSCPGSHEVYRACGGPGCEEICPLVFGGRTIQQFKYISGKATCPTGCSTPACVCAEGYTRDSDTGQCVLTPDCPPPSCPGSNEVYTACGGPGCEEICPLVFGGRTIQQFKYISGKATCPTGCSTPACVCAEGYTRDSATGQCVLTPDCPPPSCPGSHEVYTACGGPGCEEICPLVFGGRTIQQFKYISGKATCPTGCSTPACVCAEGYTRDSATGQCVLTPDCPPPSCPGSHEVYTACGGPGCEEICPLVFGGRTIQQFKYISGKATCPTGCSTPACVCAEGYTRDSATGQCVLTPDCPPPSCPGSHEVYTACGGPGCEEICPLVFGGRTIQQFKYISGKATCPTGCSTPACVCAEGYTRDSATGQCVLTPDCPPPSCPGSHEVYTACGGPGCEEICPLVFGGRTIQQFKYISGKATCPTGCSTPACVCAEGYTRDSATGQCVLTPDCPPPSCPGSHEVYTACGGPGCEEICPLVFGGRTIQQFKYISGKATCPTGCSTPACVCAEGYTRDSATGQCVLTPDCPPPSCPGSHEVYTACGGPGCEEICPLVFGGRTIQQFKYISGKATCPTGCSTPACVCAEGYTRDSATGQCVLTPDCPPPSCPGSHEVYTACGGPGCEEICPLVFGGRTIQQFKYISGKATCPTGCSTPACVCAEGYTRDSATGQCVLTPDCPPPSCPGSHEVYTACGGPGCEEICPLVFGGRTIQQFKYISGKATCPTGCSTPACVCAEGYTRDSATGQCVLTPDCPPPSCPGSHEVYTACGGPGCEEICPLVFGGRTIQQFKYISGKATCPTGCSTPACVCAEGYTRDSATGQCVLTPDCPPPSCPGSHEVYTACGGPGCEEICPLVFGGRTIQQFKYISGKATCPTGCSTPACVCAEGYTRDSATGQCVLTPDCPPPSCPGSHEVYTACGGPGCEEICPLVFGGRTIQQFKYISGKATCPTGCSTPACVCAEGYTRDSATGQCVLTPDCPPPSCPGSHEVYTACGGPGCEEICPLVFGGRTIQQFKYISGKATCPTGCSTPACVCAEGYTRDSATGQCVLTPDCPPPSCPGSHEVYTACGGPGCEEICPLVFGGRTIQQFKYISGKATCPTGCSTPACVCAEGYTRDSATGQCVLTPDCPPPSCPGSHEVYTACGGPGCEEICPLVFGGRTIQQFKYISGKATCPTGCSTPACVCAEGYTRDSATGQCVLTPDCPPPSCPGSHEVYTACGGPGCEEICPLVFGGRTIQQFKYISGKATCPTGCSTPACVCAEGYTRDSATGQCVLTPDCPPPSCPGSHEVYTACGGPGCEEICPLVFGGRTIQQFKYISGKATCPTGCSTPACVCAEGYTRDSATGQCVLTPDCPPPSCPGSHEVYTACGGPGCEEICPLVFGGRTIQQFKYISGKATCPTGCSTPACVCAEGYTRDSATGQCVLTPDCPPPSCPGSHEVYTACGGPGCEEICPLVFGGRTIQQFKYISGKATCPTGCSTPACVCAEGYTRDSATGQCVLTPDCPPPSCPGSHEVYTACGGPGCEEICPLVFGGRTIQQFKYISGKATCPTGCSTPACVCAEGYTRDSATGQCVLTPDCPPPSCPGSHEVYTVCGGPGCEGICPLVFSGRTIQQLKYNSGKATCPTGCSTPACVCAEGYTRDSATGQCVLTPDCPPPSCPGSHEVYTACGGPGCEATCPLVFSGRTIQQFKYISGRATCPTGCSTPACVCAEGYTRDSATGQCVLTPDCPPPSCPGSHEVYTACGGIGCDTNCPTSLRSIQNIGKISGKAVCSATCSTPACVCASGYYRNSMGQCVLIEACPPLTCPGPNQVYTVCGGVGCGTNCPSAMQRRNLNLLQITGRAVCPVGCTTPGCICASGYAKDSTGNCILIASCPYYCSKPNQVYSLCGNNICQSTCSDLTNTGCTSNCVPGCICATGYVLDYNGNCVLPNACPPPPVCPPNEVFTVCKNHACQKTCTIEPGANCVRRCTKGCICATGYIRNYDGVCVLPTACMCPSNERYGSCGKLACEGTCANPDPGVNSNCDTTGICVGKCFCVPGFVRENGVCQNKNRSCPGPNEMYSECGDDGCQPTCTRQDVSGCMSTCGTPACVCQSGYVRDASGVCIQPPLCPCSGPNEMYFACGEDGCQPTCTRQDVSGCTPSCGTPKCVCQSGYVRNAAEVCTTPSLCPCPGPNEVYSACGSDGCQSSCSMPVASGCVPTCSTPRCVCQTGYLRNPSGVCVTPSLCPCSGSNEVYSLCGNDGCQPSCTVPVASGCIPTCSAPRCICHTGDIRNPSGPVLVLTKSTPHVATIVCQPTCERKVVTSCTPICTTASCICQPGCVRNVNGVCIPPASCQNCPTRERYRTCGRGQCESTCAMPNLANDPNCDNSSQCVARCFCVPGWVRGSQQTCIQQSNCRQD